MKKANSGMKLITLVMVLIASSLVADASANGQNNKAANTNMNENTNVLNSNNVNNSSNHHNVSNNSHSSSSGVGVGYGVGVGIGNGGQGGAGGLGGNSSQSQDQGQHQHQIQGQDQGQHQNSSSDSSSNQHQQANNKGNAQSVNFNQARQHNNTPGMGAMFAYPTAPCAIPVGANGVGPGIGIGIMTAYINQECVKSETAKLALARERADSAQEIFCLMEHSKNTRECRALAKEIAAEDSANVMAVKTPPEQIAHSVPAELITDGGQRIRKLPTGGWERFDEVNGSWTLVSMASSL